MASVKCARIGDNVWNALSQPAAMYAVWWSATDAAQVVLVVSSPSAADWQRRRRRCALKWEVWFTRWDCDWKVVCATWKCVLHFELVHHAEWPMRVEWRDSRRMNRPRPVGQGFTLISQTVIGVVYGLSAVAEAPLYKCLSTWFT